MRMIGALREAGLLAAGAVAPAVPPEPKQGPQVGDEVRAQGIRQINKRVLANGSKDFAFGTKQEEGQWWWVECRFPPNDNHWLAEIDKVLASPKPSIFHVVVEVTQVVGVYGYMTIVEGELKELTAVYRTPELPALSIS